MKKQIKKIVALLLTLALSISLTTVFITAAEGDVKLYIYRTFDEGWEINNGFSYVRKAHKFYVDSELSPDLSYNYYCHLDYQDPSGGAADDYLQFTMDDFNGQDYKLPDHTIMRFKFKAPAPLSSGQLAYTMVYNYTSQGYTDTGAQTILAAERKSVGGTIVGSLTALGQTLCEYPLDEWITITYDYAWDTDEVVSDSDMFQAKCYAKNGGTVTVTAVDSIGNVLGTVTKTGGLNRIPQIRIGNGTGKDHNDNVGLDDFAIYDLRGTDTLLTDAELAKLGYGSAVNPAATKTVTIKSPEAPGAEKTMLERLDHSAALKVGVNHYLIDNETTGTFMTDATGKAVGGPIKENGVVYLPLSFLFTYLKYIFRTYEDGKSINASNGNHVIVVREGGRAAMVNGETVLLDSEPLYRTFTGGGSEIYLSVADCRNLLPGVEIFYHSMGFILVSDVGGAFRFEEADVTTLVEAMKKFLFDQPSGDTLYADVEANTDGFAHPYIYTNQTRFDELRAAYLANEGDENYDPILKAWLEKLVKNCDKIDTLGDENYVPKLKPGNRYDRNHFGLGHYSGFSVQLINQALWDKDPGDQGYDEAGGRCNNSAQAASILPELAFAWQITRNDKYAIFAYHFAVALGEWVHWGPHHFLNAADAMRPYGLAYDWLYNAWTDLGLDTSVVRRALYDKGVEMGYLQCLGSGIPKTYAPVKDNSKDPSHMVNNWNAVCGSGLTIAALAMLGDETNTTRLAHTKAILSHVIKCLPEYGMGQYVPDGSYIESATYWAYGTNNFFLMAMGLATAAGDDYGLMDCWGIDRTMDFACQVESSDYMTFSFHDTTAINSAGAKPPSIESHMFTWYGLYMDRPEISARRLKQVADGVHAPTFYDAIFYDADLLAVDVDPAKDYYMEGIDAFVARSDWERGALYAGIIGNTNNLAHGQIDSGTFVYYNKGKTWLMDIGSENYNVYGFWGSSSRYKFLRNSAEAQNILFVDNEKVPLGQELNGFGKLTDYDMNEYGSYAVIDNTSCYGPLTEGGFAKRGMLMTNNRSTVVIQDEVKFAGREHVFWVANYTTSKTVTISADGRTAYMRDGDDVLRVSIVSDNSALSFRTINDVDDYLLPGTIRTETWGGTTGEYDRTHLRRLVIEGNNVSTLNLAVVMEMVEDENDTSEVGYTLVPMSEWVPVFSHGSAGPVQPQDSRDPDMLTFRPTEALSVVHLNTDVRTGVLALRAMEEAGTLLSDTDEFVYWISFVDESFRRYPPERLPSQLDEFVEAYEGYLAKYHALVTAGNAQSENVNAVVHGMLGF